MSQKPITGTGRVLFWDTERRFGFCIPTGIDAEDRDRHLYIHVGALVRSGLKELKAGDRIAFEVMPPKRPGQKSECQNIKVLLDEAA
jgi:cold shock CspA family protein